MGRAEQQEILISALYSLSKELCFPLSSLGENGKHDRLKICSISRVIGSNPIASTNVSELVCWAGPWGLLACLLACLRGAPRASITQWVRVSDCEFENTGSNPVIRQKHIIPTRLA